MPAAPGEAIASGVASCAPTSRPRPGPPTASDAVPTATPASTWRRLSLLNLLPLLIVLVLLLRRCRCTGGCGRDRSVTDRDVGTLAPRVASCGRHHLLSFACMHLRPTTDQSRW